MKMKYKWVKVPADKTEEVKELYKNEDSENEKEEKKMGKGVKVALAVGLTTVAGGLGYLAGKLSNKEKDDEFESREYVEVNPVEPDTQDTAD